MGLILDLPLRTGVAVDVTTEIDGEPVVVRMFVRALDIIEHPRGPRLRLDFTADRDIVTFRREVLLTNEEYDLYTRLSRRPKPKDSCQ